MRSALTMRPLRRLQPALAAFLAACVLLLGLATWAPALHAHLHGHAVCDDDVHAQGGAHNHDDAPAAPAPADEGHACAVTLFASGCDVAPTAIPLSPPLELSAARVAAFT